MRRREREITDLNYAADLIKEEQVLRLALSDDDGTYIVPVNYGYEIIDGSLSFCIHGALQGRKAEILKRAAESGEEIPFEIDGRHAPLISDSCDATYYYMSIMGKVRVNILDGEDKLHALNKLMDNVIPAEAYHFQEAVVSKTMVCRLAVTEWTCKENRI